MHVMSESNQGNVFIFCYNTFRVLVTLLKSFIMHIFLYIVYTMLLLLISPQKRHPLKPLKEVEKKDWSFKIMQSLLNLTLELGSRPKFDKTMSKSL